MKPSWIRSTLLDPATHLRTQKLLRDHGVNTVCEGALCPNQGECFSRRTATFLILGRTCTRACTFCAIPSEEHPPAPDPQEPGRIAGAAAELGLKHVVITSVTRDDLADGGAGQFAAAIGAIRDRSGSRSPVAGAVGELAAGETPVEVLIPDFGGAPGALGAVLAAGPAVLNHNIETVPRLYPRVRPLADYPRSLALLRLAREIAPAIPTKSGLMVGFGEQFDEVVAVMRDLAAAGVGSLTIGQYLQPGLESLPVARYWHPEEFEALAAAGRGAGLGRVTAGPLVRSSYRAREAYRPGAGILPG